MFAWAALAKLRNVAQTRAGFVALGVPAPRFNAVFVPTMEVSVATGLLLLPWVGAVVALGLLLLFTVFLTGRLRAGVRVPCNCFGSAGNAPLSARDLYRNAALAAACLFVVAIGPKPDFPSSHWPIVTSAHDHAASAD